MVGAERERARVLRVITRLNIGGPARHAMILTKGLASEFPTALAAGHVDAFEGELADPEVDVQRVPLTRPLNPLRDSQALMAVSRLLDRTGAELVHTHMAKAGAVGRTAAVLRSSRPRLIHTFHGHVLEGYFPKIEEKAFIALERWLARRTDLLIAVSPEVRDSLIALKVGRPSQFHVVNVGLDLEPFLQVSDSPTGLRADLGLGPETPLVGVVGRLVPIKNHEMLFAAIRDLPDVHLAVIGDGELRGRLTEQAIQLGIADRVHFTGWWANVAEAMGDLDVVALTSRNEGTPVALIEALAAGRPVVATDVGGVREVVRHGVDGLLAGSGDSAGVARALLTLLSDAPLRRQMGASGRERVRDRFGRARLLREMAGIYRNVLGMRDSAIA